MKIRNIALLLFALIFIVPRISVAAPNWSSVEKNLRDQKISQAFKQLADILRQAKRSKDNKNWRQALILGAVLRNQRGQFENAIKFLENQSWPKDNQSQLLIYLHKAYLLSSYVQNYRWEIQNREEIKTRIKLSLKKKTMGQLVNEINQSFAKAYLLASQNDLPLSSFTMQLRDMNSYFDLPDYSPHIRGYIRDTVAYLWVDFLADSSLWDAQQSNESNQLTLKQLLSISSQHKLGGAQKTHPLKRLVWLLSDLEQFQIKQNRPEAALEAFRVKALRLAQLKNTKADISLLINMLRTRIAQSSPSLAWTNMLRYQLASLVRQTGADDANIQSIAILKQCLALHKKHRATTFCQNQFNDITKPYVSISSMKSDGLDKRSLLLSHKNIQTLYFRAWRLNLQQAIENDSYKISQQILLKNSQKYTYQWQVSLPSSRDYKAHNTYVTPPIKQYGYWLIAASTKADFSNTDKTNIVVSTALNLTRFVASTQNDGKTINVTVYNGSSGQTASDVAVQLWSQTYNKPARLLSSSITSKQGQASLKTNKNNNQSMNLVLKYKDDFTLVKGIYSYAQSDNQQVKNALVFTDRAIYRPAQKILWKVVAYKGKQTMGKYSIFANSAGWVKLFDANGKLVEQKQVKTNQYGSASGEFTAKTGLLLGNWRLHTSWGGNQTIKVEEYKRPTFTVKIKPSKQSLALNRPARVTGSAKYYFGQAVTAGKVKWRVKRKPVDLWKYGSRGGFIKAITVASGSSVINASGEFHINFTPKPATPTQLLGLSSQPPQYTFTIIVELTDSGGETRKATRQFTIGKVGIVADITRQYKFGVAGKPYQIDISRHDLNGTARPGAAFWELYQIQQPKLPIMPAEEQDSSKKKNKFATKEDTIKSRWAVSSNTFEMIAAKWKDARKVQQGALRHDKEGLANINLQKLGAGLYRLRYTTKDQWGQVFKTQFPLIIAHQNQKTIVSPALLLVQKSSVEVGKKVDLLVGSAFKQVPTLLEIYHGEKLLKRTFQRGGIKQLSFPVGPEHRGGLNFVLTLVKDYQLIQKQEFITVPWSNKNLNVSFSTFRDKLQPGQKETWRVTVKDSNNKPLAKGATEVLASMYDRSLDLFAKLYPADITSLYIQHYPARMRKNNLGQSPQLYNKQYAYYLPLQSYQKAQLALFNQTQYEKAVPLSAGMVAPAPAYAPRATPKRAYAPVNVNALQRKLKAGDKQAKAITADNDDLSTIKTRSNFIETAFFYPHLILDKNGSVTFEFEAPESLTQWKVWVSALTKDLAGGVATKLATTSKELMVRPYLPRFLRAGDQANIDVLINNGGEKALSGRLEFDVIDPKTLKTIKAKFRLKNSIKNFKVVAGKSQRLRFSITTPRDLGTIAIRARASASDGTSKYADGEQRPLPILPSRIHLSQSRFTALQGNTTKKLQFKELASNKDTSRINDKLVVTVDGQLFYSTLDALPYLVSYPYECTEQTMNRFLSTSIITSVFRGHPAIASMAKQLSKRATGLEKWDEVDSDPNRKMLLEETPWLNNAQGGSTEIDTLINLLDPKIANRHTQKSLKKLQKAQNASGGFPWWEGGKESIYMTTYLLHGFSRALEFNVNIPKHMVKKAWRYLDREFENNLKKKLNNHLNTLTLINYVLSAYPDPSWTGDVFSAKDKKLMLDLSFKHWRKLSPMLKAYLALTLKRSQRMQDAQQVFDSLMDAARTDDELGTYWAPEDRSWLWYNDRIDTHAFMLRTMLELNPRDNRRHGLVQWLMLNKKLNHWKSTRATAESIYSLVHYLKQEKLLGLEERATIKLGNHINKQLNFKPNEYTGAKNQLLVTGNKIKPDMANISIQNQSRSLMFASATWHFSTEKLPKSAQGDFFKVTRKFFKRVKQGGKPVLQPLQEGAQIKVGDQLEVQLSLRAKHAAEFVHLRAPRGAGFEPEIKSSGYQWNSAIGYYEEIRDSGANYFFERLPAGEYSFKYRLRATTAGAFRVAPAMVQSIYAPEFNAYSSGKRLIIR